MDIMEEFWNTPIRQISVLSPKKRQRLAQERLAEHADSWCNEIEQATLDNLSPERAGKARSAFRYVRKGGFSPAERVERFAKIHAWAFCRR